MATGGSWAHDHRPDDGLMVNNRTKRMRKQTTTMVDGQAVLKINNYTLEDGSIQAAEAASAALVAQAPKPPRAPNNAYNFYSSENQHLVDGMPFAARTSQLAQLWFNTLPEQRARYDGLAVADKARFVRETAEHEEAMDLYEVKLQEAKEEQQQADWRALQAADKEREERIERDRLHREWKKTQPKKEKKMSAIEQRLATHNAGMKAYTEAPPRLQARSAFIMQHAAVLVSTQVSCLCL
jgi:hypothetical protein